MRDYKKGKIYKLVSDQTDKIYIGSTCEPILCRRLAKHRSDFKLYLKGKSHYVTSYELVKYNDCKILLLEKYPCESSDELLARESHWIKKFKSKCVNKYIPARTKKQFYEDNAEKIKQRSKQYREEHKETIIENSKDYYAKNKDAIFEKKKQYYQENKTEINKKRKEKFNCYCGSTVRLSDKARHIKSKTHKRYEQLEQMIKLHDYFQQKTLKYAKYLNIFC